jgi:hypothetical protein
MVGSFQSEIFTIGEMILFVKSKIVTINILVICNFLHKKLSSGCEQYAGNV